MGYDKHGTWQDSDSRNDFSTTPAHVEGEWLPGPRFAKVFGARRREEVSAYMPRGFAVIGEGMQDGRAFFVIGGYDNAGWTLDGYVAPRLGSGLMGCEEIGEREARIIVASSGRQDSFIGLPARP